MLEHWRGDALHWTWVCSRYYQGIGVTGCLWLIVALCRSPAEEKDQIQILRSVAVDVPVDVEQGSEAIVTDNVGGEQGQGSTVVATDNGEQASSATAKITVS